MDFSLRNTKTKESKNINGNLARQMKEYLIKLFCTVNEVQKQKENSETGKLLKQMEEMKRDMNVLREENKKLRLELENIKNSVKQTNSTNQKNREGKLQIKKQRNKEKAKEKEVSKEKETMSNEGVPRSPRISIGNKPGVIQSRRELKYPLAPRNSDSQGETPKSVERIQYLKRKEKESLSSKKKRVERINSIDSSVRKKKNRGQPVAKEQEQPELWSKIIGRKEKRQNKRREEEE